MGIPFYFKKLTSEFSDIVAPELPAHKCNRLFLDFNCGIHFCVGQIREEQHAKKNMLSHSAFESLLIKKCCDLIKDLVRCAVPTDLLYVSIDGVPPMAKIAQQRKRRYFSDWRRTQLLRRLEHSNPEQLRQLKHEWNSNCITPGTNFMERLMKSLDLFCREFEYVHKIKVVFSPFQEYGEGEHKICHYIRQHDCQEDCVDVIYGLDADMILLGMLSKNSMNTFLMREPVFYKSHTTSGETPIRYLFMDIKRTMTCVCDQWCSFLNLGESPPPSAINERSFIVKCYVVLTFLLGNDFLPHLSHLRLRDNGLETLLNAYRQTHERCGGTHIILPDKDDLNLPFLLNLFEILSIPEDVEFRNAEETYFARTPPNIKSMLPSKSRDDFKFEGKKLDFYPSFHKFTHRLFTDNMQGWRTNYYYHLFDKDPHSNIVTKACTSYLQGIVWCCDYYFKQQTNWAWFYKYNYSPTILDLYNYTSSLERLSNFTSLDVGANSDYVKVHEQLLMVIPPGSKFIIPNNEHKKYMTDISKGVVHVFPIDFEIVTYLKSQLHECAGNGLNLDEKLFI